MKERKSKKKIINKIINKERQKDAKEMNVKLKASCHLLNFQQNCKKPAGELDFII